MKTSLSILFGCVVGKIWVVQGMPTIENIGKHLNSHSVGLEHRTGQGCPYQEIQDQLKKRVEKRMLLDPLTTPIDVSGEHEFVPPNFAAGDVRGPCPGLNALANHGYLPHNGVAGMLDAIDAINTVLGMGIDLGTFLSVFATTMVGDLLSLDPGFSLGGQTLDVEDILGNALGLIGTPQGLDGSHNFIESDSSPTRGDLYQIGDNFRLQLPNFMELYNLVDDPVGDYTMDTMLTHAKNRYQQSVSENPHFYYGPVSGMVFRNAGYAFSGRMFRNYSAENPDGVLTKDVLKSFFAIYGEDNDLKYKEGWEQIPQNWYRTPVDYSILSLNLDITAWILQDPSIANIGGNTGTVNSFTGVDIGNLTGGVYNAANLLEGNNLMCFALEVVKFLSPNSLSGLYATIDQALGPLTNALLGPISALACPEIQDLTAGGEPAWQALQALYPGAAKSGRAF